MEVLIALIPLAITIAIYVWLFGRFRAKHGVEGTGPQGQAPYGIHGWLAFFIFASYYIAPIYGLGRAASNLRMAEMAYPALIDVPGYGDYKLGSYLLALGLIIWQIRVAHQLRWRHAPQSLRQAKTLCFLGPCIVAAADTALGWSTLGVLPDASAVGTYITGIISSGLWGLYFVKSRRCRNTYLLDQRSALGGDVAAVTQTRASTPVTPVDPSLSQGVKPLSTFKPDRVEPVDEHYRLAAEEVDGGRLDKGLWEHQFAEADGDPGKTRARYIAKRAQQIAREQSAREPA